MDTLYLSHTDPSANRLPGITVDPAKTVRYRGQILEALKFVTDRQLTDTVLWKRFVDQFRADSDGFDRGWRGEYFGKMMRAGCYVYSTTGDKKLYRVLSDAVNDMMSVAADDGRISSYARENEFCGWDLWARKYVMLGMLYFREVCASKAQSAKILRCVKRQADYLLARIGSEADGKMPINKTSVAHGGLNSASILEPIVKLYRATGEKKYLDFAEHIISSGGSEFGNLFDMAENDLMDPYQYPVTKAYEMISTFEGLIEYYYATGNKRYRDIAVRFGERLLETDITIIGSAGTTHEFLDAATYRQTSDRYTGLKQETCVTVTWMKFCFRMLDVTGDPKYVDCFEQALYNAYLGAFNTENVTNTRGLNTKKFLQPAIYQMLPFDSYTDLLRGTRGRGVGGSKQMADGTYYGCCACIGAAGIGLCSHIGLMKDADGAVLNLYADAKLTTETPNGTPLTLNVSGGYPKKGKITVKVDPAKGEAFALTLRIPSWSVRTKLTVCGKEVPVAAGYTKISKFWNPGDVVVLELDMRTEVLKPLRWEKLIVRGTVDWGKSRGIVEEEKYDERFGNYIALRRGPLMFARAKGIPDNNFDPVSVAVDSHGYTRAALIPSDCSFPTVCELRVPLTDGRSIRVADCSSVGKTWDEETEYEIWIPSKQ